MNLEDVKKLREETGLPLGQCKEALVEAGGDVEEARKKLAEFAKDAIAKKAHRDLGAGAIFTYIHGGGNIGVMLELNCETDFVVKNEEFQQLGKDIALHVAAMSPENVEELMAQQFVKDPSTTVEELIGSKVQKIGERIELTRFVRYELLS